MIKIKQNVKKILIRRYPFVLQQYYLLQTRRKCKVDGIIPKTVAIESTTLCNSRCIFCPHGVKGKLKREKRVMDDAIFTEIVNKCAREGIEEISFGGLGEFLIDRNFIKKAWYIKNSGVQLGGLTTNGMLMNKDTVDELVRLKFKKINISIDSANKEEYEKLRVNLKFKTVIENTIYLVEKLKGTSCSTVVHIVTVYFNYDDIKRNNIIETFNKYLDGRLIINFIPLHNWGGQVGNSNKNIIKIPCNRLFNRHLLIRVDGSLSLCCQDYNNLFPLGNVLSDGSFFSLWNSSKMQGIRMAHLNKKWDNISICSQCSDIYMDRKPYIAIENSKQLKRLSGEKY